MSGASVRLALLSSLLLPLGCKQEEPPPPDTGPEPLEPGAECDPDAQYDWESEGGGEGGTDGDTGGEEPEAACAPGLSCQQVGDGDKYVCGTALEIRGKVLDALSGDPIEGALVAALDETGAPVTDVVETDECGDYTLPVDVRRDDQGELVEMPKWTLIASAADYEPFPDGLRPALPVDTADKMPDPDFEEDGGTGTGGDEDENGYPADVIENAATTVALIPLEDADAGGATVSGVVLGDGAAGALVVAEGQEGRRPYGIADASGFYTLFNVPNGNATIRAYRQGLEVEAAELMVDGGTVEDVDLDVISEDPGEMADVNGMLNIVNADGNLTTSVVLVPSSVFNEALERGPVPFGLRDPSPPTPPNVSSDFGIVGVPSGTYKVLVAFENDQLVRDPDDSIAGTAIQEINVNFGDAVTVDETFKVTEALAIIGPGADTPEKLDDAPQFQWTDDSGEDRYELVVYDALGNLVWEDLNVAGVMGNDTVSVDYAGDPLTTGMYYQFRVTSFADGPNGSSALSRTEDLRGVFVVGEAPPPEECSVDDEDGGTGETG